MSHTNNSLETDAQRWSVAIWSGAVLALTVFHHLYGAALYAAPFRRHALGVALPLALVIAALLWLGWIQRARAAGGHFDRAAVALVLAAPVAIIGIFEGGYNHILKNVLYFGGAPADVLRTLYPFPTYAMPDDLLFELTGVIQLPLALVAGRVALRFLRTARPLRSRDPGAPRP